MKFTCVTNHLKQALASAERFIGKNTTLPVLSHILISADQHTLTLTATNLESAIRVTVHGSGARPGSVCVPAKVLSLFIQSIGDEKIQIEEKQGGLLVKTDTRDTRINGVPSDDFPLIPKIKKMHSFTLSGSLLSDGISRVLPAVSLSEFKPELGGVYVNISPMSVRLAATDTFRLAEKTITFESRKEIEPFSFIMPYRISQEITRVCNGDEEVTLSVGENQIILESDGYMVVSRLTEGNFPEYGAIIPKHFEASCFVERDVFMNTVRASSIFASKLQEVTMALKNRTLEIASLNQDVGEYKNIIPCVPSSAKETTVGFNYKYLLAGLQSAHEEDIFFGVNGDQSPCFIKNI